MTFKLLSDIHTEFWDGEDILDPGTGDVLILAGDIGVVDTIGIPEGKSYERFLDRCAEGYKTVFYVLGNHEYYGGDFLTTPDRLREFTSRYNNVSVLSNNSEHYDGVHYVGATMWANFNNMDPDVMDLCGKSMNDYNYITNNNKDLTPSDTLIEHTETREWFDKCLDSLNGPVVMITHHAPSILSITGYVGNELQAAYYTDMSSLIEKYPNIQSWCHGHVHVTSNYFIGECNVVANPFGYYDRALNPQFKTA